MTALTLYIILCVLVVIGVALTLVGPIVRRKRAWFVGEGSSELVLLRERKELAMRELKDLESGHQSGKIQDDEYQRINAAAMERAREASSALDSYTNKAQQVRESLEADVAAKTKALSEATSK